MVGTGLTESIVYYNRILQMDITINDNSTDLKSWINNKSKFVYSININSM